MRVPERYRRHLVGGVGGVQIQLNVAFPPAALPAPADGAAARPSNWRGSTVISLRACRSTTRMRTPDWRMRSRSSEARYHWIFSPRQLRARQVEERPDLELACRDSASSDAPRRTTL